MNAQYPDDDFRVSSRDIAEGLARVGQSCEQASVSFEELIRILSDTEE